MLFGFASSLQAQSINATPPPSIMMEMAWNRCRTAAQNPAKTPFTWSKALEKPDGAYDRYPKGRSEVRSTRAARDGEANTGRHLIVTKASDKVMKATRWIWEDNRDHWIPMGELTGLAGREGVGNQPGPPTSPPKSPEVKTQPCQGDNLGTPKVS